MFNSKYLIKALLLAPIILWGLTSVGFSATVVQNDLGWPEDENELINQSLKLKAAAQAAMKELTQPQKEELYRHIRSEKGTPLTVMAVLKWFCGCGHNTGKDKIREALVSTYNVWAEGYLSEYSAAMDLMRLIWEMDLGPHRTIDVLNTANSIGG